MKLINRIKAKGYYLFANLIINQQPINLPDTIKRKRNLFLYFDYEREFGGHNTLISDNDINCLLSELNKYKLKATWFTVGKIIEKYPNSIKAIANEGHEIASHTFSHISPYKVSTGLLEKDFDSFRAASKNLFTPAGFHSPNGKWSISLIELLIRNKYIYDVVSSKGSKMLTKIIKKNNAGLLRFTTIGDDWPLFKSKLNKKQVFDHYVNLFNRLPIDQIAGIGAHPWVLFSNKEILEGYFQFLHFLSIQQDLNINTASFYANHIISTQRIK